MAAAAAAGAPNPLTDAQLHSVWVDIIQLEELTLGRRLGAPIQVYNIPEPWTSSYLFGAPLSSQCYQRLVFPGSYSPPFPVAIRSVLLLRRARLDSFETGQAAAIERFKSNQVSQLCRGISRTKCTSYPETMFCVLELSPLCVCKAHAVMELLRSMVSFGLGHVDVDIQNQECPPASQRILIYI